MMRAGAEVVLTSESDLWRTKRALIAWLHRTVGPIDLDAFASDATIAPRFYGPSIHAAAQDGFTAVWSGRTFWNPPYSLVARAARKAVGELAHKREDGDRLETIGLVGVRSDTAWWQDTFTAWSEVWLLRGRLRFWLTAEELAAINDRREALAQARGHAFKPLSDENSAPFPSAILIGRSWEDPRYRQTIVRCVDWRRV